MGAIRLRHAPPLKPARHSESGKVFQSGDGADAEHRRALHTDHWSRRQQRWSGARPSRRGRQEYARRAGVRATRPALVARLLSRQGEEGQRADGNCGAGRLQRFQPRELCELRRQSQLAVLWAGCRGAAFTSVAVFLPLHVLVWYNEATRSGPDILNRRAQKWYKRVTPTLQ